SAPRRGSHARNREARPGPPPCHRPPGFPGSGRGGSSHSVAPGPRKLERPSPPRRPRQVTATVSPRTTWPKISKLQGCYGPSPLKQGRGVGGAGWLPPHRQSLSPTAGARGVWFSLFIVARLGFRRQLTAGNQLLPLLDGGGPLVLGTQRIITELLAGGNQAGQVPVRQ